MLLEIRINLILSAKHHPYVNINKQINKPNENEASTTKQTHDFG